MRKVTSSSPLLVECDDSCFTTDSVVWSKYPSGGGEHFLMSYGHESWKVTPWSGISEVLLALRAPLRARCNRTRSPQFLGGGRLMGRKCPLSWDVDSVMAVAVLRCGTSVGGAALSLWLALELGLDATISRSLSVVSTFGEYI